MKRFRLLTHCVGRLVALLYKIRRRNATALIRKVFLGQAKKCVKTKRKQRAALIENICERVLTNGPIFNIVAYRKFKVLSKQLLFIQRVLRKAIFYRKNVYKRIVNRWEVLEILVRKAIGPKVNLRRIHLSMLTKTFYIRRHFLGKLKLAVQELMLFNEKVSELRRRESFFWTDLNVLSSFMVHKPLVPRIFSYFTTESFSALIKQALVEQEVTKSPH
jgi:hypothetical protein